MIQSPAVPLRRFTVSRMGNDGIRIGAKSGADTVTVANSTLLDDIRSGYNERDGLHIDDVTAGSIDTNTFQLNNPKLINNTRHGFYANRTFLGGTVVAGLYESNGAEGIYLDAACNHLVFMGGDAEANNGGSTFADQLFEAEPFANRFYGLAVQGLLYSTENQSGEYEPTVYGATSAGAAGGYSVQAGRIKVIGKAGEVAINLTWIGHTGTGQGYVALPTTLNGATLTTDTAAPSSLLLKCRAPAFQSPLAGEL